MIRPTRTVLIASTILLIGLGFWELPRIVNAICMLASGILSVYAVYVATTLGFILRRTNSKQPNVPFNLSLLLSLFVAYPAYRIWLAISSIAMTLLYFDRTFPEALFAHGDVWMSPLPYFAFVAERLTLGLVPGLRTFTLSSLRLSDQGLGWLFDWVSLTGAFFYTLDFIRAWGTSIGRLLINRGAVDQDTISEIDGHAREEASPLFEWVNSLPKLGLVLGLATVALFLFSSWYFGLVPAFVAVLLAIGTLVALALTLVLAAFISSSVSTNLGTDVAP